LLFAAPSNAEAGIVPTPHLYTSSPKTKPLTPEEQAQKDKAGFFACLKNNTLVNACSGYLHSTRGVYNITDQMEELVEKRIRCEVEERPVEDAIRKTPRTLKYHLQWGPTDSSYCSTQEGIAYAYERCKKTLQSTNIARKVFVLREQGWSDCTTAYIEALRKVSPFGPVADSGAVTEFAEKMNALADQHEQCEKNSRPEMDKIREDTALGRAIGPTTNGYCQFHIGAARKLAGIHNECSEALPAINVQRSLEGLPSHEWNACGVAYVKALERVTPKMQATAVPYLP
jgi:hypothetical protein